ncbi:hypothetical protein AAWM_03078 [Aspergillus awamori]|uniref:Uncharacterized protein n=1 Tax=Aspergillus awamori TaxID=105351 RepID=A0A401KLP4_ASPAW|nr:hypothetical protein AAWM_03078 [Aspergillus awamori]GKZ53897.1 hypothetical protein AnigIFM49718_008682 [Aspergillus niger]
MASSSDHPHDRENNDNHNKPNRPALKIDTTIIAPTTTARASAGTEVPSPESSSPPQSAVSSMSTASSILSNSSREFILQLAHPNATDGEPDDGIVLLMWPVPVSTPAPVSSPVSPALPVNQAAPAQNQDHVQGLGDQSAQVTGYDQTTMEDLATAMAETEISSVSGADCDEVNVDRVDQTLTNSESNNNDIDQDIAANDPCDPGYDADTSTSLDDDCDYEAIHAFWENVVSDGHDDAVEQEEGHGHPTSSFVQE